MKLCPRGCNAALTQRPDDYPKCLHCGYEDYQAVDLPMMSSVGSTMTTLTDSVLKPGSITQHSIVGRYRKRKTAPAGLKNGAGSLHYKAKLTEEDIPKIRQMFRDGMTEKAIARRYKVTIPTVSSVITGQTWVHVRD